MITFKNIQISYDDFIAIPQLDLTIEEGEFFTFLGPSGCGKTTTLRALVGFLQPTAGSISIFGEDITQAPVERRGIGMVFQSYALFPTMTVFENIAFGLKVKKLTPAAIQEKVLQVAEKIEINDKQLQRNVAELSGGQQQRVALARAIVLEPKILCLDEPLSNLDAKLRVGLRGELKRLQKRLGITTLYVTHDQEEALILSDRIAVFNQGRIEQVGTPYEIYNHSASRFVCDFIGDINRLEPELLKRVNTGSGSTFNTDREGFIRLERLESVPRAGSVPISGEILEIEYRGIMTTYMASACGQQVRFLQTNDGTPFRNVGETVELHIHPEDIMQFA